MRHAALLLGTLATVQVGSASAIEIIWTLTGLIGAYLTWNNLRDARKSIVALRRMNGRNLAMRREMQIISFGHYRNEIFRMLAFGVILSIGVAAMVTPPVQARQPVTPVALVITLGLLALTGILVASSFLDRRQREELLREP